MSHLLARLANRSADRPFIAILGVLLALTAVTAFVVIGTPRLSASMTIDDLPAQTVLDDIGLRIPRASGSQGSIIVSAPEGRRLDGGSEAAALIDGISRLTATGVVVDRGAAAREHDQEIRDRVAEQIRAREGEIFAKADEHVRAREPQIRAQVRSTLGPTAPAGQVDAAVASALDQARETARTAAVKGATDQALTTARAQAETLTSGPRPAGQPFVVDGKPVPGVRLSDDGRTALIPVLLTGQLADLPADTPETILDAVSEAVTPNGLTAYLSQSLAPSEPPLGGGEVLGIGVALLVLLLTLGSIVAAGLPIAIAVAGVALGVGTAVGLSPWIAMTTSTPALGLMIGLAVGIDYSLLVVHKHRRLILDRGLSAREAIPLAVGTAGSAVVFAGGTVVIAVLGLLVLRIGFVTTMALTAAATVSIAVGLTVLVLPALLALVGERIVPQRARRAAHRVTAHADGEGTVGRRWIRGVTARPWVTAGAVTVLLALLAIPAASLRLGMPSGATAQPGTPQRLAYDAVTDGFGAGATGPLLVSVTSTGTPAPDDIEGWLQTVADLDDVANVQLVGATEDRTFILLGVTPATGPSDPQTEILVHQLREHVRLDGVTSVGVTGWTALNLDLSASLAADVPIYVGIVVALSVVILVIAFRSVLVPVVATGGFLLSIAATMGLAVLVFSDGRFTELARLDRPGPILSFLPIMVTGILYGLAMDYQVFLTSAVREHRAHGATQAAAVDLGFQHASRVVVAAATIMVAVFGGFVLSHDPTIIQFGFALSSGILLDAFLVRMVLMPAVLHALGDRCWWLPAWLDRLLPRVDIEGASLEAGSAHPDPGVPGHEPAVPSAQPAESLH